MSYCGINKNILKSQNILLSENLRFRGLSAVFGVVLDLGLCPAGPQGDLDSVVYVQGHSLAFGVTWQGRNPVLSVGVVGALVPKITHSHHAVLAVPYRLRILKRRIKDTV